MVKELLKLDLYAILGVEETAGEKELLKGYRKRALKCHPDKNPDNPKAAEEFHQLSEALEILTDAAARSAYDRSRKAKKENDARNQALDSKRKKFKEDLEARERAAEETIKAQKTVAAEKNLQKEVERLRKEGSRLLEQEQARLREELKLNKSEPVGESDATEVDVARIKLKWKAAKDDMNNGGYNERILTNIINCHGHIDSLIISRKRNGSAIVEFGSSGVLSSILQEKGLSESPFTITWLSGKPSRDSANEKDCSSDRVSPLFSQHTRPDLAVPLASESPVTDSFASMPFHNENTAGQWTSGGLDQAGSGNSGSGKDFENLVIMKMRQAEERKRLIAKLQEEDEGNG